MSRALKQYLSATCNLGQVMTMTLLTYWFP